MLHCPHTPIRKRALHPARLLCASFQTLICTWQGHQLLKKYCASLQPNWLTRGSVQHQICSFRFFCFSHSMNSQGTKNSSTKCSSIKCSSTKFNSLNSLITLQVQEFKLQAQESKFQAQVFQVSSTSFKFKTEKRLKSPIPSILLKRGFT